MSLLDRFRNKKVLLYSDSDLDGVGCRVMFEYYIKPISSESHIFTSSDREMTEFPFDLSDKMDIIIFTDITPTKEGYLKLIESGKEVFIFDHHQSAYNELFNTVHENYFYTIEKCGTRIFFDSLSENRRVKKPVAQFVELVDTYDRWQETSLLWKDAKKLHNVLYGYANYFDKTLTSTSIHDNFVRKQLEKFEFAKVFYFSVYEEGLSAKEEQKEKDNYEKAKSNISFRKDSSGNSYAYFECSSKMSLVANRILKEYADKIDYVICHSTWLEEAKQEINGKVSLRSNGAFDVSLIAARHGGGGHLNSAGIELDIDTFNNVKKGVLHLN